MDIDSLIREKRLIEAIRLRREQTGEGLKEAKDYCEARRRDLGLEPKSIKKAREAAENEAWVAAKPEVFDALKAAEEYMGPRLELMLSVMDKLRAAIARAEKGA